MTLDQARADACADLVLARASVETTVELVVPVAALRDDRDDPEPSTVGGEGPGIYRWSEHRSPSEILREEGVSDDLILQWVSGEELHLASVLEAEYALALAGHLERSGNPHLSHAPPPPASLADRPTGPASRVGAWFVPGHVDAPRVGAVLPGNLSAILVDPATRIRIVGSDATTGTAVTDSTAAYRPGRIMARRVQRRDGACRFPGCGTPAERTQLNHVTRWPDGPTVETNLVCLCATHHGFKHHVGWRLSMTPDGVCTWTAPTGRAHTTRPEDTHSSSG